VPPISPDRFLAAGFFISAYQVRGHSRNPCGTSEVSKVLWVCSRDALRVNGPDVLVVREQRAVGNRTVRPGAFRKRAKCCRARSKVSKSESKWKSEFKCTKPLRYKKYLHQAYKENTCCTYILKFVILTRSPSLKPAICPFFYPGGNFLFPFSFFLLPVCMTFYRWSSDGSPAARQKTQAVEFKYCYVTLHFVSEVRKLLEFGHQATGCEDDGWRDRKV